MKKPQATPSEPDPEAFSLEFLMSAPPDTLSDSDLDTIIQYHRNVRADRAAAATAPKGSRKRGASPPSQTAIPTGLKKLLASKKPTIDRRGF